MARTRKEPTYERFITGRLQRFDEDHTAYSRADRGEILGTRDALKRGLETKAARDIPGYTREDFALALAGRTIDSLCRKMVLSRADMPRRWNMPDGKMPVRDPSRMSEKVKRVARWFGAAATGICEINPLWLYSRWGTHNVKLAPQFHVGDPVELPEGVRYAVVMAIEMDYVDVQRSPALSPSTDLGYSQQAFAASSVAEFIRALGWQAIPSGNDMALSIPLAVDAGLGELGRNGQLITERFGPRVRLCKVFTDLPLQPDEPIDLGVQHFCDVCGKCAKRCPGNAIPKGERTDQPVNVSTSPGMLKWPVHADRCLEWWNRNGGYCTNCIRVCPYNKPKTPVHSVVRGILQRTSLLDRALLLGDDLLGYGRQVLRETPSRKVHGRTP
ncbi:MAG: hypothetical protein Kow0092_08440 [Deferrisomatales bacterium]